MRRLLIAEDEQSIREMLVELLSPIFEIIEACDGRQALQLAMDHAPDLILMDVSMPQMNGTEVCSKLKGHPSTQSIPVVLLTAHGEVTDKVHGFSMGADDYITKPFHPEELVARLEARIRAIHARESVVSPRVVGNLELDPLDRQARVSGVRVRLTQMEVDLLSYFLSRVGQVVPRKQLLGDLWPDAVVARRTVDTHVANLRKKLKGFDHEFEPVHGTGYRLRRS